MKIKAMNTFTGQTLNDIDKFLTANCLSPQVGDFAFSTLENRYYYNNGYNWIPLSSSTTDKLYKVEFGTGLPFTSSIQALSSLPQEKGVTAIVVDKNKDEITTNYFDGTKWLVHQSKPVGLNHFDFTYYDTTASQNADAVNKNEHDLSYNKETGDLYFLDSTKTWVHMNLNNKNTGHDVGFRLVDVSGDGNDDVYNVDGHRLMLTDASGNILSLEHPGQAVPKQYVDMTAKDILDRLNEFFQTQKVTIPGLTAKTVNGAINELLSLGTAQSKQIADSLKHLQNINHFTSFDPDSTDPTVPSTKEGALLTIANPVNNERAYVVDKKNNVTYLYLRYNDKWEILNDNVGGGVTNILNKFINPCQTKMLKLDTWSGKEYKPSYNVKLDTHGDVDLSSISHESAQEGTFIWNPQSQYSGAPNIQKMMVFHNNNWLLITSPIYPNIPNVGDTVTTSAGDITIVDKLTWFEDVHQWVEYEAGGVNSMYAHVLLGRVGDNPNPTQTTDDKEYRNSAFIITTDLSKPGVVKEYWFEDKTKPWETPTDTRGPVVKNCEYFTYAGGHSEYPWESIMKFIQAQMPKKPTDPNIYGPKEQFIKFLGNPHNAIGFNGNEEISLQSGGMHLLDSSGNPFIASSLDSPVTKKYLESVTGKQYKTTNGTFPSDLMNLSSNYIVQIVAKVSANSKTYEVNLGSFELASIKEMQSGFNEPETIKRSIDGADSTFTINHTGITSTPAISEMRITVLTKVHS